MRKGRIKGRGRGKRVEGGVKVQPPKVGPGSDLGVWVV